MSSTTLLSAEERRLARHALGLPGRDGKSYRNRYVIMPHTPTGQIWEGLMNRGLARKISAGAQAHALYELTEQAALAALEAGETLCSEDFPEVTHG